MSVEFYWLAHRSSQPPLVTLSDHDFETLADALVRLKEIGGVWLDPYMTTRISPSHAKVLAEAIEDQSGANSKIASNLNVGLFLELLRRAVQAEEWLVAEGD